MILKISAFKKLGYK